MLLSRRQIPPVVVALVAGLVLGACHSASAASSDGEAEVKAARAEQNAAIAARDLDRVASFWTDSVTVTAGLGTGLRGRAAYRRAFEQDARMRYERTPQQVVVSPTWPLAWEQGTWVGRGASTGGGVPILGGSYAAQWVKSGSRWLIRSELFVATSCRGPACQWPAAQP